MRPLMPGQLPTTSATRVVAPPQDHTWPSKDQPATAVQTDLVTTTRGAAYRRGFQTWPRIPCSTMVTSRTVRVNAAANASRATNLRRSARDRGGRATPRAVPGRPPGCRRAWPARAAGQPVPGSAVGYAVAKSDTSGGSRSSSQPTTCSSNPAPTGGRSAGHPAGAPCLTNPAWSATRTAGSRRCGSSRPLRGVDAHWGVELHHATLSAVTRTVDGIAPSLSAVTPSMSKTSCPVNPRNRRSHPPGTAAEAHPSRSGWSGGSARTIRR